MRKTLLLFLFIISISIKAQDHFPDWAKGIVWYQIFPERFANGDTTNDPKAEKIFTRGTSPQNWKPTRWTSNWFEKADWEKDHGERSRIPYGQRRYGGDLKGIIDHLDYLKDLGITGIYFNPMFDAVSAHKYDGSTYHHIDINFGPDPEGDKKLIASEIPEDPSTWKWTSADKMFLTLVQEVHKRGMRIIIDGVFNHVGTEFWAFKDLYKNQEKSKYKDWFMIKKFDDPNTPQNEFDFQGWWNSKTLPQFNRTANDLAEGPKKYIFYATHRWMDPNENGDFSDGIDGWRLDVARDVPIGFWNNWSKYVKEINKKAIIIGELWEISKDFISETGPFDALMNYNFAYAVNNFFIANQKKISVTEFIDQLKEIDKSYPEKTLDLLQNLLDSHDTERLSSMIKNPDRNYDRDGSENNPDYDPSKPGTREINKQKLIAAFQLTYKGAPMIYYGDEVGIWGADDPHDRKPMIWKELKYDNEVIDSLSGFHKGFGSSKVEVDRNLLDHYKTLISIRNGNEALKIGSVEFIFSDNKNSTFAFIRKSDRQQVLCLFNSGTTAINAAIPFEAKKIRYKDMVTGKEEESLLSNNSIKVELNPQSFKIYNIVSVDAK